MDPDELLKDALEAKDGRNSCMRQMTLVLPYKFKRPPGFPRGDFLSETPMGRVYSYDPDSIINWLEANNLVPS